MRLGNLEVNPNRVPEGRLCCSCVPVSRARHASTLLPSLGQYRATSPAILASSTCSKTHQHCVRLVKDVCLSMRPCGLYVTLLPSRLPSEPVPACTRTCKTQLRYQPRISLSRPQRAHGWYVHRWAHRCLFPCAPHPCVRCSRRAAIPTWRRPQATTWPPSPACGG
jgi:hypothetical protein